ncbi:nucleotidyltransferase family protein [Algoriphagus sp. A40]|uniref:nucleotidyltransferase family protein n=1 Tax=Algoriphagus sp. A40 TaxID=1945863 RepID=UPI000985B3EB|nr:nucleotidyltransferase domain-containing protein [Algoriphagus sp. A40]OOG70489.1 hypothetical protein B0E43_17940 [Algoriphagus sp. A40]
MISQIRDHSEEIKMICKDHFVSKLFLFGSAVNGVFKPESDLDFAVLFSEKLTPLEHGEAFFSLQNALEKLFGRKVDLISYRVVKNPIFKEELDKTKITLYAA